jgi:SAM-dependent methyltransferase
MLPLTEPATKSSLGSMPSNPHASWAEVYDAAYEQAFGGVYETLTVNTIAAVRRKCPPPAALVDFGAGTGRLAVPLAVQGYTVTAVEPCTEMLDELRRKDPECRVRAIGSSMQDFQSDQRFDVALCVFTVLIYLLDDASLRASFRSAAGCLKADGWLLLDIPSCQVFRPGEVSKRPGFWRSWQVDPVPGESDLYAYTEKIKINDGRGAERYYEDSFRIRHWQEGIVMKVAEDCGLAKVEGPLPEFSETGSSYFWLRKF